MTKNYFPENNKQEIPRTNDRFHIILKINLSFLSHGKHQKRPGKGHGKSWNFIRSKEYEPCVTRLSSLMVMLLPGSTAHAHAYIHHRINQPFIFHHFRAGLGDGAEMSSGKNMSLGTIRQKIQQQGISE